MMSDLPMSSIDSIFFAHVLGALFSSPVLVVAEACLYLTCIYKAYTFNMYGRQLRTSWSGLRMGRSEGCLQSAQA